MLQHEQVVVSYEQKKIKGPDFSDPIIYHLNLYTLYYIETLKISFSPTLERVTI